MDGDKTLSGEELEQIYKQYFLGGLSKLFIYHFQNGDAVSQESVPPELSERIVLCSAEDMAWKE